MSETKIFMMPGPMKAAMFKPPGKEVKAGWEATKTEQYARLHTSVRWQRCRDLQLSAFPLCEFKGCDHPATVVHRVRPDDMAAFFDAENHRSLCERHHAGIGRMLKMGMETMQFFKERKADENRSD